jgi:hypothetical protein
MTMQQVSLPRTITGSIYSSKGLDYLHNCFNIDGEIIPRLGFHRLGSTLVGADHANSEAEVLMVGGGKMYAQFYQSLFNVSTVADDGAFPGKIATVSTGVTGWAASSDKLVFLAGGGFNTMLIDTTNDTVTNITDLDRRGFSSVVYIDGRFIFCDIYGEVIYFSDVNDPATIQALSFFDAESRPDLNKELAVIGNDLWVFGEESIERLVATGSATAPFTRATNSIIAVGYVGGMTRLSDRVIFIGRPVGGSIAAYQLMGGRLTKISNQSVDEILNTVDTTDITSQSFSMLGRDIYTFSFGDPLAYTEEIGGGYSKPASTDDNSMDGEQFSLYCMSGSDGPQWGFMSSLRDNTTNLRQGDWGIADLATDIPDFDRKLTARFAVYFNGRWNFLIGQKYSTDVLEDNFGLYTLADRKYSKGNLNVDYGEAEMPITKGVKMGYRAKPGESVALSAVHVAYNKQGFNRASTEANPTGGDSTDTVNLRASGAGVGWGYEDDANVNGKGWSDEISRPIGDKGDDHRLTFTKAGGIANTNSYMGVIIESRAKVPFVIEGVYVES